MRIDLRDALAWTAATAIGLAPQASQACAVCFSATRENRMAFIITTGLLTSLPLLMVGGTILWLRHRAHQLEAAEQAALE